MWVQRKQYLPNNEINRIQRMIEYQEGIIRTLRIKKYLELPVDPCQLTKEKELLGRLHQKLNGFEWIE